MLTTVAELIAILQRQPAEAIVVLAGDAFGHTYSPYDYCAVGTYTPEPEDAWTGECGTAGEFDYPRAICLYPRH